VCFCGLAYTIFRSTAPSRPSNIRRDLKCPSVGTAQNSPLTVFRLILQTIIIAQMLSAGGEGRVIGVITNYPCY